MRLKLFIGSVFLVGSILVALGGCAREAAVATSPSVTTTSASDPSAGDPGRVPERPSNEAVRAELEAAQRAKAADAGANANADAGANANADEHADGG